ncbi:MAG: hypothetical protein FWD65_00900 [Coriobacteriia bacterium]|nr:hypothetical protein [Coriobacteriia bacterium]
MKLRKYFTLLLAFVMALSLSTVAPTIAVAAGTTGGGKGWNPSTTLPKKTPQHHSRVTTDTPSGGGSAGSAAVAGQAAGDGSGAVRVGVGPAVCEIDGTPYDTLGDAFAAITDNTQTTIKLLTSITYTDSCTLMDRNITFDLNGCDLTFNCATDTALKLINCNIDYTNTQAGGGSFKVISGVAYDDKIENDPMFSGNGVALLISGGSCHVTSVQSTGQDGTAVACTGAATVTIGAMLPRAASGAARSATGSAAASAAAAGINVVQATGAGISWGVLADVGCSVVVDGDISTTAMGVIASGANVDIRGNITVKSDDIAFGIVVEDFTDNRDAPKSVITMMGNITAEGSFVAGVMLDAKADVTLGSASNLGGLGGKSNITLKGGYGMAIAADAGSTVTMVGDITGTGGSSDGLDVFDAKVTLQGNITVDGTGIYAGYGTTNVTGNITATGGDSAVDAEGGKVSVTGDVKTTAGDASAIFADSSTLTVKGNVTATGKESFGIEAYDGAKVTVTGNITAAGNGIDAEDQHTAIVAKGNVTSTKGAGVYVDGRATTTVDGTITAATHYIEIGSATKAIEDFSTPTTKAGYKTYTDNKSTVWVKDATVPGPQPPVVHPKKKKPHTVNPPVQGLPGTGDSVNLIASGALLVGAAVAAVVFTSMKRRAVKTGKAS